MSISARAMTLAASSIVTSECSLHNERGLRSEDSNVCFVGYADHGMRRVARKRTQTELLSLVDILEPLSNEELEDVAAHCPDIHLKRGEDLYYPKEHHGGLFIIQQGRVRVYKSSSQGDQLTLALLSAGTCPSRRRRRRSGGHRGTGGSKLR